MGEGDLSDPDFDNRSRMFTLNSFYDDFSLHETADLESCTYTFHLRSSPEFEEIFSSTLPLVFSLVVAGIFPLMAITFLMYDRLVTQRNQKITTAAVRSTAIVTSLFPSNVRDRLYAGNEDGDLDAKYPARSSTARLKRFVDKGSANDSEDTVLTTKPIADLFPETTVMFGDIGESEYQLLLPSLIRLCVLTRINSSNTQLVSPHGAQCESLVRCFCFLRPFIVALTGEPSVLHSTSLINCYGSLLV